MNLWISFLRNLPWKGLFIKNLSGSDLGTVDWASLASLNENMLLGIDVEEMQEVIEALVSAGVPPSTRCVLVHEKTYTLGELGDIHWRTRNLTAGPVSLLLGEEITRYSPPALFGQTILITRAKKQAPELKTLLEQQGAIVHEIPTIEIQTISDQIQRLSEALKNIREYSWLILTSVNTVDYVNDILKEGGKDWRLFESLQIACIGESTARKVRNFGGTVSLVPQKFQAESLLEALTGADLSGKRLLLPRAEGSRMILPLELGKRGATVDEIKIYRAELPASAKNELEKLLQQGNIDFITFTSSSTVRNFMNLAAEILPELSRMPRVACIGPITATTMREFGIEPDVVAEEFTIHGLVKAIASAISAPLR